MSEHFGPLCEGAPAKRVGERNFLMPEVLNTGKALSLRPFGPPPPQREAVLTRALIPQLLREFFLQFYYSHNYFVTFAVHSAQNILSVNVETVQ